MDKKIINKLKELGVCYPKARTFKQFEKELEKLGLQNEVLISVGYGCVMPEKNYQDFLKLNIDMKNYFFIFNREGN